MLPHAFSKSKDIDIWSRHQALIGPVEELTNVYVTFLRIQERAVLAFGEE
jgi:hypothetical protein